ncbi:MAG: ABC transporter substrate-binding protein [Synergistaceae bacterium]|jgi:iron complex transport system substrate-binding protein|nr:ABC transporter substrate-binding protein [Synergistaceae bacterium]
MNSKKVLFIKEPTTLKIVAFLCAVWFSASLGECGPRRIVSLYPGHTDNIAALGGGERLVAVSGGDFSYLHPGTIRLPIRVGAEAVLALKPDVVFLRSLAVQLNPHLAGALERAGVTVHVIDPPSWDGFEDYLTRLAEILGVNPAEARAKLQNLRGGIAREAEARSKGDSPRVFLETTSRELRTCSPDSWAARLIELAGGANAARNAAPLREGSPLAPWGVERVLALAGELDVYLVQQGPMNAATLDDVRSRPWFSALSVQNVRLASIPESCLSRPSLLGLEEGGKILMEIFYGAPRGQVGFRSKGVLRLW